MQKRKKNSRKLSKMNLDFFKSGFLVVLIDSFFFLMYKLNAVGKSVYPRVLDLEIYLL